MSLLLIITLAAPFVYGSFWKPRIVNKTQDYFVVSKIERMTMTCEKWIFVYGSLFLIAFLYDDAYQVLVEGVSSRSGALMVEIVLLCIWNGLMFLCCREHSSLPMRKYLNAKEMIKSIESERFYQIGEKLWYSQNWIRISTRFFPKSAITGIKISGKTRKSATVSVDVYTIHGKIYKCYDFSYYDKELHDKVNRLLETLPISRLTDLDDYVMRNNLRDFKGRKLFDTYMKSHTTTEFINKPGLLATVVDIVQMRG